MPEASPSAQCSTSSSPRTFATTFHRINVVVHPEHRTRPRPRCNLVFHTVISSTIRERTRDDGTSRPVRPRRKHREQCELDRVPFAIIPVDFARGACYSSPRTLHTFVFPPSFSLRFSLSRFTSLSFLTSSAARIARELCSCTYTFTRVHLDSFVPDPCLLCPSRFLCDPREMLVTGRASRRRRGRGACRWCTVP